MTTLPFLTSLKVANIGGGSREWANKLMTGVAIYPVRTGQTLFNDPTNARPLDCSVIRFTAGLHTSRKSLTVPDESHNRA